MKRSDLLRTKEYWLADIQLKLFNQIEGYIKNKNINKTQLAEELHVTKGYVTQILSGDFDHKMSKLVELSLACNSIPLLYFVKKEEFIKNDSLDNIYELIPINRHQNVLLVPQPEIKNERPHFTMQVLNEQPYGAC